jgi:hypothetical protein
MLHQNEPSDGLDSVVYAILPKISAKDMLAMIRMNSLFLMLLKSTSVSTTIPLAKTDTIEHIWKLRAQSIIAGSGQNLSKLVSEPAPTAQPPGRAISDRGKTGPVLSG